MQNVKRYNPPHPAHVEWEDVFRLQEPHSSAAALELDDKVVFSHRCFVVAETPEAIWVCAAVAEDGDSICDVNRIPRGCVRSIHWEKVEE